MGCCAVHQAVWGHTKGNILISLIMKILKNIFRMGLLSMVLVMASCEDFLDINEDPNNPTDVPMSQLLSASEVRIGSITDIATGVTRFTHEYMQYTSVRGNLNHNIITGNDFVVTAPWDRAYLTMLTDLRDLIAKGEETESWHYVGVAKLIKAYTFSVLVDYYGDVPYFDANLGSENPTPSFDNGAAIYADLFTLIDEAIANLAAESTLSPGTDDIIYKGDLNKWRKFGKSLKLKLYNTIRDVQNVSAPVQALIAEGDLISSIDESFQIPYGSSTAPDDRNQGYATEYASGTHSYVNPYFYEIMTNKNTFGHQGLKFGIPDPRVPYYFYNQLQPGEDPENPTAYYEASTGFLSIYSFSYNIDPNEGFDQSSSQTVMGLYPIGGRFDEGDGVVIDFNGFAAGPLRLLPYMNVLFIQAELAAAGVTQGDAEALLRAAMTAAFAEVNAIASAAGAPSIPAADRNLYINTVIANTFGSAPLETIMTQKWIANFGGPVDVYSDYRRTGFPVLHDGNTDALTVTERTRDWILSLPYSTADLDLYLNPPAQRNPYLSRVFWDID